MANFRSASTKRKLDQLEDETQFSSKKKIKAEENNHQEDIILFSALPREIIHFILSFITNDAQRRHIRLVCRQWLDYINYNEFKIGLLLTSEVDEFSRCFGRYQKPIALKFTRLGCGYNTDSNRNSNKTLMKLSQFQSMLSSLTRLTALDLRLLSFEVPPDLINLQSLTVISPLKDVTSRLTNLRILQTDREFAHLPTTLESLYLDDRFQSPIVIDRSYSRLTELIAYSTTFEFPDTLPNLRRLVLEPGSRERNQMDLVKFPNLEEFIAGVDSTLLPAHYPSTLTKLHSLSYGTFEINEDLTQLKDLKCFSVKVPRLRMCSLEDCVVSHNYDAIILNRIDPQKVTKLEISLVPESCRNRFRLFTNLIDLNITLDKSTAVDAVPYLVPLTRLTQLRLSYDVYPQQWMTQLTNLVNLSTKQSQQFYSTPESINFEMVHHLTSLVLSGSYNTISIINLTNLLNLKIQNENAITIHGLSTATNLTSLAVSQRNLQDSSSVTKSTKLALLTNLCVLSLDRKSNTEMINIADLTTLQRLTFLEIRASTQSTWYLTRLSRLQQIYLGSSEPNEVARNGILKGLPFCYHFDVRLY